MGTGETENHKGSAFGDDVKRRDRQGRCHRGARLTDVDADKIVDRPGDVVDRFVKFEGEGRGRSYMIVPDLNPPASVSDGVRRGGIQ